MSKKELFRITKVKVYGLNKVLLYHTEHLYYYQNIFVRSEELNISENFAFIKICGEVDNAVLENNKFVNHFLTLFNTEVLPHYGEINLFDDSINYILHGATANVLTFFDKIVAIGNLKGNIWIPVDNFFNYIENIENFKELYLKMEICKKLGKILDGFDELELTYKYVEEKYIRNNLEYFINFLHGGEFKNYLDSLNDEKPI